MAKFTPDAVLDNFLNGIAIGSRITVLTAQPLVFADIAALQLASAVLTPGNGNSFTHANGDISGRKTTVGQATDLPITATGNGNHVAIDDGVNLLHVTTATPQALTAGGTVTIPAWDIEIADPI